MSLEYPKPRYDPLLLNDLFSSLIVNKQDKEVILLSGQLRSDDNFKSTKCYAVV